MQRQALRRQHGVECSSPLLRKGSVAIHNPLFTVHCWSTGPDDWCGKQSTGESVPVRWKAPTVPLLRASAVASAPAVNNHYEPWPTVLEDLICLSTHLHHAQQSAGVTECVEQTRMRSGARDGNERELAASWHVRDGPALTALDGWFISTASAGLTCNHRRRRRPINEVPPLSARRQFPGLGYWT